MTSQEQVIADIAREVVARLRAQMQQQPTAGSTVGRTASPSSAARDGVFVTVDEAANAADAAAKKVGEMSLEDRGRMIAIVRRICIDRADELGKMELEETKVGRLDHKIQKLKNMQYVVGIEGMRSDARTDTSGLCLIEHAPWGAIGMVLPVTHCGADDGGECDQYPGRRKHGCVCAASFRQARDAVCSATLQPRD